MEKNKFYVTTPIYYVTAKPHLGSLYSTLLADITARWQKLQGKKVFFLTGTDEHGQKIAEAAQKAGMEPKTFVDSFIGSYKDVWKQYDIDYSYFIRTTDQHHVHAVQEWLKKLLAHGDIYKSTYTGWYCVSDEAYLTDKEVEDSRAAGNSTPRCPQCSRETRQVSEESYFFKLSAYQDKLLKFYAQHPDFIAPKERLHEVISFVQSGLKDLSISRTTITWGIPFPGDTHHVTYVWADALNNYITAIGYGQPGKEQEFNFWWPADLHILGKDIVRFHAVFWPAFLMASGLAVPKKLLVHGWIKVNDQKMSKSLGNVVDPLMLQQEYGTDQVRYYLARHIAVTQDSSFSSADLEQSINADLANDLGNLLNRMVTLALKHNKNKICPPATWSPATSQLRDGYHTMLAQFAQDMNNCLYHMALSAVWKFIHQVNAYFHAHEPWKLAEKDPHLFEEIMSAVCHSLEAVGVVLWPIMPTKMEQLLHSIGSKIVHEHDMLADFKTNSWHKTFSIQLLPPLFKKIEQKKDVPVEEQKKVHEAPSTVISIDDLIKVELVVGTIVQVNEVPKSEKLFQLKVDFGPLGTRQILAGVRQSFSPEYLSGKQAVFVYNLKPRLMMGLESHGMMLVAHDLAGVSQLVTPGAQVPNGTRLK